MRKIHIRPPIYRYPNPRQILSWHFFCIIQNYGVLNIFQLPLLFSQLCHLRKMYIVCCLFPISSEQGILLFSISISRNLAISFRCAHAYSETSFLISTMGLVNAYRRRSLLPYISSSLSNYITNIIALSWLPSYTALLVFSWGNSPFMFCAKLGIYMPPYLMYNSHGGTLFARYCANDVSIDWAECIS